ncbi:MAG TPA: HGxxPAAW family protein [Propionibacteriaceae bacterium]
MADTAQHEKHETNARGAVIHHGRTPAAWLGSMTAMVAFLVGGLAVVLQNWPVFWGAVALLVLGLIGTRVLQVMGYGAR